MSPPKNNDGHLELVKNDTRKKPVPSPRVLKRIEDDTLESSKQLIEHMFSAIDDLFYELSKRASSNNEENLYFESMRELRIKKGGLTSSFLQSLKQSYTELLQPDPSYTETDVDDDIEANLSIVEGDDLEIDLALKGMATRTRETFKSELYEICIRLDHLLLQVNVSEKNNPLDPQQIARAFVESCKEQLKINIKTRLIVFKLFEKHVLKQLGRIYADVNQILVETGILPKVPKSLNKNQQPAHGPHGEQAQLGSPEAMASQPQELVHNDPSVSLTQNAIATLMAAIRKSQGSLYTTPGKHGAENNYYFYASNPGPVMNSPDLARNLTTKQPLIDQALINSEEPKNILPEVVTELLSTQNPNQPQALAQPDEDTINLVALFFDKVLEDENLPIAVQSLICRLQIPILKLALQDGTFLTDKNHPARRLINTITKVGLSLDDSKPVEKDPLFKKLVEGVHTINKQYKLDTGIFEEVQLELEKHVEKEVKKSNVVEKRTTQTEEGKIKVKHARGFAQAALYEKMKETPLHPKISEFLTNTWLQVLVITYLKDGKEGSNWVENEQLITDMIWLCQPHQDERSLARAQRMKPDIFARIEKGLATAVDSQESRSAIISNIEETISEIENAPVIEEIELQSLTNEQKETLGRTGDYEKPWEEMTALERQQSRYEELSSKFYQKAKETPVGTWVEYHDEKNGRVVRCKLSAKIDAESYIFVTRLGFKALEKSRRQFAYDMQFNKAKILDSSPLFDRVMNNIVNHFTQAA